MRGGEAGIRREQPSRELAALAHEFPDVSTELVERFVDDALRELATARIDAFVPLLVHRRARERLLALTSSARSPGNDGPGPA